MKTSETKAMVKAWEEHERACDTAHAGSFRAGFDTGVGTKKKEKWAMWEKWVECNGITFDSFKCLLASQKAWEAARK